ncbi:MAG: hypothetical protein AB8G11_20810 [Saprospiraceae bacterium]
MKKTTLVFILLIINTLSLIAQHKLEERIKTIDGNIYVGEVVMETEEIVKIIIDKQTIVNIDKSTIISRELANNRKRNHIISGEISNYYLLGSGLNYDINLYRRDNYIVGGTLSAGILGMKIGGFGGYRLVWEDILKAEVGLGVTLPWIGNAPNTFSGPYVEFGYRSQRDIRWFYWEVSIGSIFDVANNSGNFPYGSVGIGVSF